MTKINRVGILCPYWFPEGKAATNRIKAYSKGLILNGVEVDVIAFFPRSINDPNPLSGNYAGIQYEYINSTSSTNGLIKHTFDRVRIILKTFSYIRQSHYEKPYDFILLSFDLPLWLILFGIMTHFLGIKNAFVCDEFPDAIRKMKKNVPKCQLFLYKLAFLFIDCRILMTDALQKFYDTQVCKKPTYILSSIVDTEKFKVVQKTLPKRRYMCYMGSLILVKDNVDNIINAFSLVANKYSDIDFHIYGPTSNLDYQILKSLVSDLELENRVIFKGWVNFSEVPQILADATILVTSQPDTKRAEGGFPTKMGEYMMSHTPMIVTDVGEITKYVKDQQTAFVVKPSNPYEYAKKISFILENPRLASEVAQNAFIEANQKYAGESVVRSLISFMQEI